MSIRIGENISFLRKEKGLTQDELAKELNVSNQAVSKWEAGKCCPDIELLPLLAHFFGVSIDELLVSKCLTTATPTNKSADPVISRALKIVQEDHVVSASVLQQKLKIGHRQAQRMIADMCESGYIVKDASSNYKYLENGNAIK